MKFDLLLFFSLALSSFKVNAQEICMVSADEVTGLDYVIYWAQPANISNIDSVIIYKQSTPITGFFRIGAMKVGAATSTHYTDVNANTMAFSRYKIAFKDYSNIQGPQSLWHQPAVLDYPGLNGGDFMWTAYEIENQTSVNYISEYRILIDYSGTGAYTLLGTILNDETAFADPSWFSNSAAYYILEVGLPTCNYIEKANINTSRSNIKQQFSNAEAGITKPSLKGAVFEILSNPIVDELTIEFESELIDAKTWIISTNGEVVNTSPFSGNKLQISVAHLSKGMYFFNVEVNGVVSTKRFVKS